MLLFGMLTTDFSEEKLKKSVNIVCVLFCGPRKNILFYSQFIISRKI